MNKAIRQAREKRGRLAEGLAAQWLRVKGYHILERRFRCREGEIDIIARKGEVLAFVEVKQRSRIEDAVEAVSYTSERRIMEAAQVYIESHPELFETDLKATVRHEVDAFRAYD